MTTKFQDAAPEGDTAIDDPPVTKLVLVVDDERDIRRPLARMLESHGYGTLQATNGAEALDYLRRIPTIDLVLMDVMMPEIDGYQALASMREERPLNRTPVVMLTAKSQTTDAVKGYSLGADYYIPKPFANETVLNAVDYLIGDLSPDERREIETSL